VNLLVASDEIATVVYVRCRRGHGLGRRVCAGHGLAQRQAGAGVRVHEPYSNAIPVGRRRSVRSSWLTAVHDIDPEHDAPPVTLAIAERIVPRTGKADLVGGRAPGPGPADAIFGIAQGARDAEPGILVTGEARAHQAVEAARVEVAEEPWPDVTHVCPFAGDAGGVRRECRRDADRSAHLSAVRGFERGARARARRARAGAAGIAAGVPRTTGVDRAATGHAAAGRDATELLRDRSGSIEPGEEIACRVPARAEQRGKIAGRTFGRRRHGRHPRG